MLQKIHRSDIDAVKGMAIIAVILYHVGILPNGYLGVDSFFVLNGFLIIPSLISQIQHEDFRFVPWISKRLFRLWPIVLTASAVCLALGYMVMIPDDYENLSESVVASNVFANNILCAVTTRNYWDVVNEYKPLMQMWFLGIVVQFYLLYPLLMLIFKRLCRGMSEHNYFWTVAVGSIGVVSFLLYVYYPDTYSNKFYYLPYRVWEFSIGGFVGLLTVKHELKRRKLSYVGYFLLGFIFIAGAKALSQVDNMTVVGLGTDSSTDKMKMALTVISAAVTGFILSAKTETGGFLSLVGKMSLSLFVWHQIILAFLRYSFIEKLNWTDFSLYIIGTFTVAFLSFKYIERIKTEKRYVRILLFTVFFMTTGIAFAIYNNAGVVRSVPELGIDMNNPYANRNTIYIDHIYRLRKPFTTSKPHVLVAGNSFARDFACIVEEYDIDNELEISYLPYFNKSEYKKVADADFIFVFGSKHKVPDEVFKAVKPTCRIYGIGTKSYGKNFGIFYAQRGKPDYFNQTIEIHPDVADLNARWKSEWGSDNFIDIMSAAQSPNGRIRIFTPDNKVISFDCRHLTKDGCKFYSKVINLNEIFKQNR